MSSAAVLKVGSMRRWAGSLLICGLAWTVRAEAVESASLRGARLFMPSDQPRFVYRAVEDLSRHVPGLVVTSNDIEATQLPIGPQIALKIDPAAGGGSESFRIEGSYDRAGTAQVRIVAPDAAGLKFGVVELIASLELSADDCYVELPLAIERAPLFLIRGMYAHLHWAYRHPYALRSWSAQDWKRYIDLLTHLGFNTIQIWPMMELLPHPLSAEDAAYLARYAEIVDYARNERGMKVFIGSCPNSITEDAKGIPIARREYWDFEKRLDPGDAASLRRLLDARSDLYRAVPGADGYWVIDSDPGGWRGSPPSDFVSILVGHRRLIDQFCARPQEQPLIYWMWYGWGPGSREENWRLTLTEIKSRLPEPWRLHVCLPEHLGVCRDLELLDRAIYFPYNLIESEPSAPLTELRLEAIGGAVGTAHEAGIDAILGNAQTPLVQLPNLACLSDRAWRDRRTLAGSQRDTLLRLARRLEPQACDLLVRGWQALEKADASVATAAARELRAIAEPPVGRSTLGPILGDWNVRIEQDLAYLLDIHARAIEFATSVDSGQDQAALLSSLHRYLGAAVTWLERTGYHNDRIVCHAAYAEPVSRALKQLERRMGARELADRIIAPAVRTFENQGSDELCQRLIETLRGARK